MAGRDEEEGGGVDPRELLPMEMWAAVFNQAGGPELANLYAASVAWRDLLHAQRSTFLPGRLAKLFMLVDNAVNFSGRDILSFRATCRAWKEGIDLFLQEHPSHIDVGFENVRSFPVPFRPIRQFDSPPPNTSVGFILSARMNQNMDAFFSKTVRYLEAGSSVRGIQSQRRQFQTVLELNNHGSRIYHATLKFNLNRTDFPGFYEVLYSFLSLLPNLNSLWIKVEVGVEDPHETKPEWEELLASQPLPELQDLMFLGLKNIPSPLLTGMLQKYSNQLKRVTFQNNTGKRPSFPPGVIKNLELRRLEQFQTFLYSKQDVLDVQSRARVWPLSHINLRWIQDSDLDLLFRSISSYSGTLKKLKLEFREVKHHNFQGVQETLKLPHLEFLKITAVQSHLNSVDFVLPCLALKEFELEMWIPTIIARGDGPAFSGAAASQVIQFGGWVDSASMYRSNIWSLLEQLKKIKIKTVTRAEEPAGVINHHFDFTRDALEVLLGGNAGNQ